MILFMLCANSGQINYEAPSMRLLPIAWTPLRRVSLDLLVWAFASVRFPVSSAKVLQVEVVSLGTISPLATSSLAFIGPALETSAEELNCGSGGYHLNFSLKFLYNSTILNGNDVQYYADQMLANWYYQDRSVTADVTVIVLSGGPEDIVVNRLAANWNVLLITVGSSKTIQRNKALSPTWIVTAVHSSSEAARFLGLVFQRYRWTSIFVILDRDASPLYYATYAGVVEQYSRDARYQFTDVILAVSDDLERRQTLQLFSSMSRVLLFLGHAIPFRLFMITAFEMGLTTSDYVYMASEPYRSHIIGEYTWKSNDEFDTTLANWEVNINGPTLAHKMPPTASRKVGVNMSPNRAAFSAFQSVLLLALDTNAVSPGPVEPRHLRQEWSRRSLEEFNYTYGEGELLGPHVVGGRYTMYMIAQVLNGTLSSPDFNYSDGRILAEMMSDRSFLVDSKELIMDKYGLRQLNWTLSLFDPNTTAFAPFLLKMAHQQALTNLTPPKWHGLNRLPDNEPLCGFRGLRGTCTIGPFDYVPSYVGGTVGPVLIIVLISGIVVILLSRNRPQRSANDSWWILENDALQEPSGKTGKELARRLNRQKGGVRNLRIMVDFSMENL